MKIYLFLILILSSVSVFAWDASKFQKPKADLLKTKLTTIQFDVTQKEGTETPFKNEFWNNKHEGIYVDVVSGEPLFSSKDKYDSGTGWPSFSKPLVKENVTEKEDKKLFSTRTEVRSKYANSHLGHVFPDGPKPTGLRYCMNSASLKFVPKERLKEEGYSEFLKDFSMQDSATTTKVAVFAGGCFWCMQPPFDKTEGVLSTTVGYTGGTKDNPTYEETSSGTTGHREAIEITFDSTNTNYKKLLDIFWANIDPLDSRGQFCDKGEQYTSAVFFEDEEQKKEFEKSKVELEKNPALKGKIATSLLPAKKFYAAEEYHQSYYKKNPLRYKFYRGNCGRDKRLKEVWGKSSHD